MPDKMAVDVVYAAEDEQFLVPVSVHCGATVQDALDASGLTARFPGHRLDELECGIWGEVAERSRPLRAGDRVELYRPLAMDPREARRQLALSGRTMGRSNKPCQGR
jgi:putative ubiquitin-RnfH superfamily antitoxin RatB of RatAB toxin-antitoxin module